MTCVLHRNVSVTPPSIVSAKGVWVTDRDGKTYLDAVSGGAAVSCIGHQDPRVTDAIREQLDKVSYVHSSFFTTNPAEELAEQLIRQAPKGLSRVLFCSGGSEAVEAALKLVRQTWVERGEPQRTRIISRRQSYHGATLGALSVGGNLARSEIYKPMLFEGHWIEPCYSYRLQQDGESLEEYGLRAANLLEEALLELGPETVGAFIMEPVVGATLGCAPAAPGYLRRIREICDQYGVLLVFDEIMCGMGRTGTLYACEEDGVVPDLLTTAKGLGGGFQPIGAVLVGDRILQDLYAGSGALKHGFTYMAHPVACAGALAVQKVIHEDRLLEKVQARGAQFIQSLREEFAEHPHVGDIRGKGLFVGIELVADRSAKTPFDPGLNLNATVKRLTLEEGLMTYPGGGTIDGRRGDHVVFSPAYTVTEPEITEIVSRFSKGLNRALETINQI
ncbi:aspartate aminotransferase family protein [Sneathiella chinensis]|uniref:Aspartate aminotransferase family protein n=1 Tax=Sneathiella chinensis TaxID=349750 RepID=A0ABQ5U4P9_9PROT|nr:aspartate aminotransferase family protein [Sneathiella chinensis]GLQ06803.1 aspartate aminotransferase family protein [Sneathiella chinensis]